MSARSVYVVMWTEQRIGEPRARAMFAQASRKRTAIRAANGLQRTGLTTGVVVYAVPAPGRGWDCPTIRATFDPIYRPRQVTP